MHIVTLACILVIDCACQCAGNDFIDNLFGTRAYVLCGCAAGQASQLVGDNVEQWANVMVLRFQTAIREHC